MEGYREFREYLELPPKRQLPDMPEWLHPHMEESEGPCSPPTRDSLMDDYTEVVRMFRETFPGWRARSEDIDRTIISDPLTIRCLLVAFDIVVDEFWRWGADCSEEDIEEVREPLEFVQRILDIARDWIAGVDIRELSGELEEALQQGADYQWWSVGDLLARMPCLGTEPLRYGEGRRLPVDPPILFHLISGALILGIWLIRLTPQGRQRYSYPNSEAVRDVRLWPRVISVYVRGAPAGADFDPIALALATLMGLRGYVVPDRSSGRWAHVDFLREVYRRCVARIAVAKLGKSFYGDVT